MRGLKAGLDELAEEESEDGGDMKNGQDREKGNEEIERDGGTEGRTRRTKKTERQRRRRRTKKRAGRTEGSRKKAMIRKMWRW